MFEPKQTMSSRAGRAAATVGDLIRGLPIRLRHGTRAVVVSDITEDSRKITPGALFVARSGLEHDGARFIPQAIHAGAAAILLETGKDVAVQHASIIEADDPDRAAALIAERFFGAPSSSLRLVGITGTNGKTTTAWLIRHLLNHAGRRCGLAGTILADDGRLETAAALTTPPAIEISRLLGRMVTNGCGAAAMEVSSHALAQGRCCALRFAVGIFTNLSGDHLDYHGTMVEYARAKAMLFESLDASATAIVNIDDAASSMMIEATRARVLSCSIARNADCFARILQRSGAGSLARFEGPWGAFDIELPLVGEHNVMNALQATASVHALGVNADAIARGLACCTAPPGRLQPVTGPDDAFTVLVDYAHTDAALENVLTAVRPTVPRHGRLWVVFGCGGDRDRSKRPRMAAVTCRIADRVVVTSDNPRTESPEAIVAEIEQGIPAARAGSVLSIVDRREAIEYAIGAARPGDVIIIAGKGHEDYQIIGREKTPFDDRLIAADALRDRLHGVVPA